MQRKLKRKFTDLLLNSFVKVAKAEGNMSTATNTGVEGQVQLDNAIRMVYSKEIEFKALPLMRFRQFASVKTELGVEPGLTISMLTYDNLELGGKLKEGVRMKTQALSSSMKQITVGERGNAISVSELLLQSSFDDIMGSATILLGRDMAIVLDCELRDTALSGTNVVFANKADGTKITKRYDLTDDCIYKVSTVKDAVEVLATNNAPKYNGEAYIAFVHPHQSRGLRDDPAWINASNYGAPQQLFNGEIGKIDDVRFIETTIMCNGVAPTGDPAYKASLVKGGKINEGDDSSNATNVYQGVIFGQNYYGFAVSLPVELRDNGVIDFGREHGLAWYAIWGTGLLHEEYGVVIETA